MIGREENKVSRMSLSVAC